MKPKFNDMYGKRSRPKVKCDPEAKAKQSFQKDCDINTIVARHAKTGQLPDATHQMRYVDCDSIPSFQEIYQARAAFETAFQELPASERAQFADSFEYADYLWDSLENASEGLSDALEPDSGDSESPPKDAAEGESGGEAQLPS